MNWIGITGSCGKSTTARVTASILSRFGKCTIPTLANLPDEVPICVLRVAPDSRFVVQEIGTTKKGYIRRSCEIVQPEVGIVTNVGTDHYSQFKDEELIAEEKADLVRSLPTEGCAVLNADDQRVMAMASHAKCRVVTFGSGGSGADYRVEQVSANWPRTLSFTLVHDGRELAVKTSLLGRHFVPNVVAGIACAHELGLPIAEVIDAVKNVRPLPGRMSEVVASNGITFIRDDAKAPWWTLELILEFARDAEATRKLLVIGEISDNPGNKGRKFRRFLNHARECFDRIVVTGVACEQLNSSLRQAEDLEAISSIADVHHFLSKELAPGDLVILKGQLADHLERLAHARAMDVQCWVGRCGRNISCASCNSLGSERGSE